jgi:hypothetical protein
MKCRNTPASEPMADKLPGNAEFSGQERRSPVFSSRPGSQIA